MCKPLKVGIIKPKQLSCLSYRLSLIRCSHVTYLTHLDTVYQSSHFIYHHLYSFEHVYLHTFYVKSLLKSYLSCHHIIPCLPDHLESTDNKLFSGLIVPRHMTPSRAVTHESWVARPLVLCNLAKAFKRSTIYLAFTFQRPSKHTLMLTYNLNLGNCHKFMR